MTLETDLEERFATGVRRHGGRPIKLAPISAGVPDRLVVWPGGIVQFIELKTESGSLSPIQQVKIGQLRDLGADVRVLSGAPEIDAYCRSH